MTTRAARPKGSASAQIQCLWTENLQLKSPRQPRRQNREPTQVIPPCGRACLPVGSDYWAPRDGQCRVLVSAEQAPGRSRRAEAGRGHRRPDAFPAGWPADHMLPAGISVVADVRHILNIHHPQRELTRHRTPADPGGHRGGPSRRTVLARMTPGLISLSKTTAPRAGSAAAIADHLMTPVYSEPLTFKPPPVEVGRIIRSWHRRQGRAPRASTSLIGAPG
jgi:hypothetical protein